MADKPQDTGLTGSADNVTVVDPDGDLKMMLDECSLQVSRKTLSLSSPVFLVMLGKDSKFMETTNVTLDHDGLQIVSFPEDDLDSMVIVTNIVHPQFKKVPTELSFRQLVHMAELCDKYDLKRCLSPYPDMWSKQYIDDCYLEGFENWLSISIVFGLNNIFRKITKHIALDSIHIDGQLFYPPGHSSKEAIPSAVLDRILATRDATMFLLCKLCQVEVERLRFSRFHPVCSYDGPQTRECDATNLGFLIQTFPTLYDYIAKDYLSSTSINEMVYDLNAIPGYGDHQQCAVGARLAVEAKTVIESFQGLNLET